MVTTKIPTFSLSVVVAAPSDLSTFLLALSLSHLLGVGGQTVTSYNEFFRKSGEREKREREKREKSRQSVTAESVTTEREREREREREDEERRHRSSQSRRCNE